MSWMSIRGFGNISYGIVKRRKQRWVFKTLWNICDGAVNYFRKKAAS